MKTNDFEEWSSCSLYHWIHSSRIRIPSSNTMNIVKCLNCHVVLESRFKHDYQQCECENETFCDGGSANQRYGGKDLNKVEVIYRPIDPKEL